MDNIFHQKVDRQAVVVQVQRKNWLKKINLEPLASPPSKEKMNLIDLPPLTKRQQVRYLPKETSEQHRAREEMAKELGIEPMGERISARGVPTLAFCVCHKTFHKCCIFSE